MLRLWSFLYASCLAVSSVAAAVIATSIYRHTELRNSAAHFVFFFFYSWLWSVFCGIFYSDKFLMVEENAPSKVESRRQRVPGCSGAPWRGEHHEPDSTMVVIHSRLGDIALMASSLWMFLMIWELSRLTRRSMDRGINGERIAVRWYCKWAHILILVFFVAEAGFTIYNRGFNSRSYRW